jgi:hypothetical protein
LRAGHAGFHLHLGVFAVDPVQLELRPDAEEQSGDQEQPIQADRMERIVNHNFKSIDSVPPVPFKGTPFLRE